MRFFSSVGKMVFHGNVTGAEHLLHNGTARRDGWPTQTIKQLVAVAPTLSVTVSILFSSERKLVNRTFLIYITFSDLICNCYIQIFSARTVLGGLYSRRNQKMWQEFNIRIREREQHPSHWTSTYIILVRELLMFIFVICWSDSCAF